MPLLNSAVAVLMRVKVGTDADPDIFDPAVALVWKPGVGLVVGPSEVPLQTDDPLTTFAWATRVVRSQAPEQPLRQALVKVTFRDAAGVELVNVTWSAYGFGVHLVHKLEVPDGKSKTDIRPSVVNLGNIAAQPAGKPAVLDIAEFGHLGVCFTAFGGADVADVATVYVRVQEWG